MMKCLNVEERSLALLFWLFYIHHKVVTTSAFSGLKSLFKSFNFFRISFMYMQFSSWNWGKIVRLLCKSYKFDPLVWGTTCNLISQVYVFLITKPLAHHKNKSNSLETRLWKDISHQTLQSNSYGKI